MVTSRPASVVLDNYFLETRAKLLEIAATLDRVDRATDTTAAKSDPRMSFIREALHVLLSDRPDRAEKIQILNSKN
jgi:hypothetical protein